MNIGVFFGSRSPEHDVSIITGELIISGLKKLGHTVYPVYIAKDGKWHIGEELGNLKAFTQKDSTALKRVGEYELDLGTVGRMIFRKKGMFGKQITIDLAFPAFHGSFGEDGCSQGIFEMFDVPYVGCDVQTSAVVMDKVSTKLMYAQYGFPTPAFLFYTKAEWEKNKVTILKEIPKKLKYPLFIKPAHLGSSIGITKVQDAKELEMAIDVALHYDTRVLVEEGVENMMDLTVCLIGNDAPIASAIQESAYDKDFFSYEDKYLKDGGAQLGNAQQSLFIPARLDEKTTKAIQETAKEIYVKMGCTGIARVDFLYDTKAKKYFSTEINPLPGTIYNHLWKASGIDTPELLTKLIEYAQEKYQQKKQITLTFESAILDQANSVKLQIKDKE